LVVLVAPPAAAEEVSDDALISRLLPLLGGEMRLSDAARTVARELGVPRGRAYAMALSLRRDRP
jgi:16S rRNA (cytidine1402-2'-O)-methyltransferase